MVAERVVEVPWALSQLPHSGLVLDVGSCEATYLDYIVQSGRELHCLDPRRCDSIPVGAVFHNMSLIGNTLRPQGCDAVLMLSTLEHIGLPTYGQTSFPNGDARALEEVWRLLKPGAPAVITVPAGSSKLTSWYRQYSPADLRRLFAHWEFEITYWGFDGRRYREIPAAEVTEYDYRDRRDICAGAGAVAGIVAHRPLATFR